MFVRFALLAFVAAVAALPAADRPFPEPITTITEEDDIGGPWFSFPSLKNLFSPLFDLIPSLTKIGPKIVANNDKFEIIMDGLNNYKKNDLKIKTKGPFLFVQGSHEVKQDEHDLFASQFFHTYTLPENASSADVTATLFSDGTLVVSAPLKGPVDKTKEEDREVPIVEAGVPYEEEDKSDKGDKKEKEDKVDKDDKDDKEDKDDKGDKGDTKDKAEAPPAPSTVALVEDRKEPTTPQGVTDKDNVIPHGNEFVNP